MLLTVGGYLYLGSLTSIPEGFNPTVGGSLYLGSLTSIPEGFNPTVGGSLYLPARFRKKVEIKRPVEGKYVKGQYIYCDGILTHVKRASRRGNYTFYVGKIPGRNVIFDGENYAHCKRFKDGVIDLEFKKAKDRGAKQYESLSLDNLVSKDDAITMYRVITGACRQGTEDFLSTIKRFKKEYTVSELIEITRGQYGASVFESFFKKER